MKKLIYTVQIDEKAEFLQRPNRFIGHCRLDTGETVIAHIHDSGRIKELLFPGNAVFLRKAQNMEKRKTEWDLISALASDGEEILINSSFHRYITDIFLRDSQISPFGELDSIKAEVKYGNSRLDYLLQKNGEKIYVETKGVSLSQDKIATFPDAPSIRAVKHLKELIELRKKGFRAAVILMVFRDSEIFRPNRETDPDFEKWFYEAISSGVEVYPIQFKIRKGKIFYTDQKIDILKKI
ncbi:MAG: DNA/RNA nuclease SfsA [Cetobacterium sp.]